jgi:hypothetical protein
MREIKYIIIKNKLSGKLRHFWSDCLHHETIARDNGYNSQDIIEAGLFLDRRCYILECQDYKHIERRKNYYIGNCLNIYQDLRLASWLKGRELESQLYYSKKAITELKPGD